MSQAWDKYQSEQSGFTPEELAILRPEYEKYCHNWFPAYGTPLPFHDWWRAMADNEMDKREGK